MYEEQAKMPAMPPGLLRGAQPRDVTPIEHVRARAVEVAKLAVEIGMSVQSRVNNLVGPEPPTPATTRGVGEVRPTRDENIIINDIADALTAIESAVIDIRQQVNRI